MKKFLLLFISFIALHSLAQENVTFQRVDEAPGDWSGEYLIVYEVTTTSGRVLQGSLEFSSHLSQISSSEVTLQRTIVDKDDPYKGLLINAGNEVLINSVVVGESNEEYSIKTKSGWYLGSLDGVDFYFSKNNLNSDYEWNLSIIYHSTLHTNLTNVKIGNKYLANTEKQSNRFPFKLATESNLALYRATSYTRSGLTEGKMGTICLPSDATISGAKIYSILGTVMKDGNLDGLVLEEQPTALAGTPYIFIAEGETMTATYSGAAKSDPETATGLVGNLNSATANVPEGCYVISNNQLRKVNGGTATIATHRAYLDLSKVGEYDGQSAKAVYWGADGILVDGVTSIRNISTTTVSDEYIYNINGTRVQGDNLTPGVYIKGRMTVNGFVGKKYIVK